MWGFVDLFLGVHLVAFSLFVIIFLTYFYGYRLLYVDIAIILLPCIFSLF